MKELSEYFKRELPAINAWLDQESARLDGLVRDVARHVLLGPGKRIRPVLTLCSARLLGFAGDAVPLACSLELLHSATLIHDDYLDDADLRRGRPAAHTLFGANETILAGDVLLALANRIGAGYDVPRINWLMAEGIMATADGEIKEIALTNEPRADMDAYLEIIIGKTARLIETSCRIGAALAGASPEVEDAVGGYGLNLGIAFQLVDDALDYDSPAELTGKPLGGDLREGKVTLPLLLLMERMDASERDGLLTAMRDHSFTDEDCARIVNLVRDGGHAQGTREAARGYVDKALESLAALPEAPERVVMEQAAEFVLTRRK